jgi:hypothetical protein
MYMMLAGSIARREGFFRSFRPSVSMLEYCASDPRDIDDSDHFPAFTPTSPPATAKGVQANRHHQVRWQTRSTVVDRCYSTTIEVLGSSNTTKLIYFPMALESAPLT